MGESTERINRGLSLRVILFIVILTLIPYSPVLQSEFINYDDPTFITDNPFISTGMTWENIAWALSADLLFDSPHTDYWLPVTHLSHLITVHFFKLDPMGHHLVNLAIHTGNAVILFLILLRMTKLLWPSTFVASLFAIHPLHVESVAWVAERKDVLSAFFYFLAIWAYLSFLKNPSFFRFAQILLAFVMSLLAKPMAVTLPGALLLLDLWPLKRIPSEAYQQGTWVRPLIRLIREKGVLFLIGGGYGILLLVSASRSGVIHSLDEFSSWVRIQNAIFSYAWYIGKVLWPVNLSIFYPHPGNTLTSAMVIGAGLFLVLTTIAVLYWMPRRPYLAIGWIWYLALLLPVIGLLQVGVQGRADRYTYLPIIGLFVLATWGTRDLLGKWPYRTKFLMVLSLMIVLLLGWMTRNQAQLWKNSQTLFEHALRVTDGNYIAHINLGSYQNEKGLTDQAMHHYTRAIQIKPDYWLPHYNLGLALAHQSSWNEALEHFSVVLRLRPSFADGHLNTGRALVKIEKIDEAILHFSRTIQLDPTLVAAHFNLAAILSKQEKISEAMLHYQHVSNLDPIYPGVHNNLGNLHALRGDIDQAIKEFHLELDAHPGDFRTFNNLGLAYRQAKQYALAIQSFQKAIDLEPGYAKAHYNLANAFRDNMRLGESAMAYQTAIFLDENLVEAYYNLGRVFVELDRIEEARIQFENAIRLSPSFDPARHALENLPR